MAAEMQWQTLESADANGGNALASWQNLTGEDVFIRYLDVAIAGSASAAADEIISWQLTKDDTYQISDTRSIWSPTWSVCAYGSVWGALCYNGTKVYPRGLVRVRAGETVYLHSLATSGSGIDAALATFQFAYESA